MIDHLPRSSAYGEALAADEELAAMMLKRSTGEDGRRATRNMREWTAEVELLSTVADRLAELIQVVGATKGAKPKQIVHQPRPVTAMQRVRARRRKRTHESLVSRLLPGRGGSKDDRPVAGDDPT